MNPAMVHNGIETEKKKPTKNVGEDGRGRNGGERRDLDFFVSVGTTARSESSTLQSVGVRSKEMRAVETTNNNVKMATTAKFRSIVVDLCGTKLEFGVGLSSQSRER
ncbi:hypothetical protein L1987_16800 [Smallanthus sonchifolius]|uniref:Uncharacterized protein n=1 Tax=Smallanthus sonchifolius TaxID=185202 RepID=A0ACB9IX69_9ASTR|nr:hypothetical protein L1987_16800 [Smallanthus sonchifolius]